MTAFKAVTLLLISIISVASAKKFVDSPGVTHFNPPNISEICEASLMQFQDIQCVRNGWGPSEEDSRLGGINEVRRYLSAHLPTFCSSSCGSELENSVKNVTASCTRARDDLEGVELARRISLIRTLRCRIVANQYCALRDSELNLSFHGFKNDTTTDFLYSLNPFPRSNYAHIQIEKLPKDVVCNGCVKAYIDISLKAENEKTGEVSARKRYYEKIVNYCANNSYSARAYSNNGGTIAAATVSSSALKLSNFITAVGGAMAFGSLLLA